MLPKCCHFTLASAANGVVKPFAGCDMSFPLLSLSVRLVLNRLQSVNLGITCYIFHSFYKVYVEKCVKSVVNDAFLVFLYSIFCINRNMSIRIVRVNKPRR